MEIVNLLINFCDKPDSQRVRKKTFNIRYIFIRSFKMHAPTPECNTQKNTAKIVWVQKLEAFMRTM